MSERTGELTGERQGALAPADADVTSLPDVQAEQTERAVPAVERDGSIATQRRMILVSGDGTDPAFESGDLAVLDRRSIGRKTLTGLVERLAEAGACGLVLNDDVMADIPLREREHLGERLPLLVLGPEHPSTRLLELAPKPAEQDTVTFLLAVLRGDPAAQEAPVGFDLTAPTRAMVFLARLDGRTPFPVEKLEELVAAEAAAADPRAVTLDLDGAVVSFVQHGEDGDGIEALGRQIVDRARSALAVPPITVGIGRPYHGIDGVRRTYREASWAATASELLGREGGVMTCRKLGVHGLLQPLVADAGSRDTEDVERLLEHDQQKGSALLHTIERFFALGSVADTASALYVHRNTVSYRLRAVKKITGLDVMGDPEARVYLEVQMRLARLRGLLPPKTAPF